MNSIFMHTTKKKLTIFIKKNKKIQYISIDYVLFITYYTIDYG